MAHLSRVSAGMIACLAALADPAFAQQPPDVVASDANFNTAMGTSALLSLNNGAQQNTAAGYGALLSNTTGNGNTAVGNEALNTNTTGIFNTAVGNEALLSNVTGFDDTAIGYEALFSNTIGYYNTASGTYALYLNTTGVNNTAVGMSALQNNTTGGSNTAAGGSSLLFNTTGVGNSGLGAFALYQNTTGIDNTALGYQTLYANTAGSNNIAVGYNAGFNIASGSNNIDIGNLGVAADNGHIRIGTAGTHKEVFIAGINPSKITGNAVYVSANGRLGVLASSERYKTAIAPMGTNTAKLGQLRPVTFKLKTDAEGTRQYGLIAEEVAKVYPELVTRDEKGRIDGVRYDELAPMLLNEVQQQAAEIRDLKQQVAKVNGLEQRLNAALQQLESKGAVVALR